MHAGLKFVNLSRAEQNVSKLLETNQREAGFSVPEVHDLIVRFRSRVARVGQFISTADAPPYHYLPVLVTRNCEHVAAYGTCRGNALVPVYMVLPQLENNAKAIVEIFQTFEGVFPDLFPDALKKVWLQGEEFKLPDEHAKDEEIKAKLVETQAIVENLRREQAQLASENDFVRQLLVATEDSKVEPDKRLSAVVKKALRFLEFSVVDIDEKTKTAIKKEDFWVSDGGFFAITEVTGTANTNPRVKEFNDILGRITTIYKRKTDLLPEGVSSVSGLLVLNYDCERHPARRPKAYAGDLEHIVESAVEQNIGILSTVELHKIIVAVKEGSLTKENARSFLKKAGRIIYGVSDSTAA